MTRTSVHGTTTPPAAGNLTASAANPADRLIDTNITQLCDLLAQVDGIPERAPITVLYKIATRTGLLVADVRRLQRIITERCPDLIAEAGAGTVTGSGDTTAGVAA